MTVLFTQATSWRKARVLNGTATSLPAKVALPHASEPALDTAAGSATAQVAKDLTSRGGADGQVQNSLLVQPYAVGNENAAFKVQVWGWRKLGNAHETLIWLPTLLAQLACTTSAFVGLATKELLATERFADTITIEEGHTDFVKVYSPANDTPGWALIDLLGSQKYELVFSTETTVTSCNALVGEL